ncbi:MAG: hypothetical protein U0W65_05915 [Bacteroidia bacterium]
MNKILFVSASPTHFSSLLPLAVFLKNDFKISFFFDERYHRISKELDECEVHDFEFQRFNDKTYPKSKLITFIEKVLWRIGFGKSWLAKVLNSFNKFKSELRYCRRFIKDQKVELIVSAENNTRTGLLFDKTAKQNKIKSIVTVFTLANSEELGYVYSRKQEYIISSFKKKLFFGVFNSWAIIYKGIPTACELTENILAKALLGLNPVNPWLSVGGNSTRIVFDSEFVKDYYCFSGLKSQKNIDLLPSVNFLNFRKINQEKDFHIKSINNSFGLYNDKPVLLCSIPPDIIKNSHFETFDQLVNFFCSVLSEDGFYNVWLSLHPRFPIDKISILSNYNVYIVNKPIELLIPLCDVFVAATSATIRYALTCKKQVLNFDIFDANYSEYKTINSVITVTNTSDFEKEYNAIKDGIYSISTQEYYKSKNNYFGDIDNLNEDFIKSYYKKLCQ